MEQLIPILIVGYGGPYVVRYVMDKMTTYAFDSAKNKVKKEFKRRYSKGEIESEYELISFDNEGVLINDPKVYVTSMSRRKGIQESWDDLRSASAVDIIERMKIMNQKS